MSEKNDLLAIADYVSLPPTQQDLELDLFLFLWCLQWKFMEIFEPPSKPLPRGQMTMFQQGFGGYASFWPSHEGVPSAAVRSANARSRSKDTFSSQIAGDEQLRPLGGQCAWQFYACLKFVVGLQ